MRPLLLIATLLITTNILFAAPASAQWAPYPAAQRDPAAEAKADDFKRQNNLPIGNTYVATTADSFEKVLAFYAARGKEHALPGPRGQAAAGYERDLPGEIRQGPKGVETIPSGRKIKQAIVILDGAPDLATSTDYMSIARPFILDVTRDGAKFIYHDVRDLTAITRMRK